MKLIEILKIEQEKVNALEGDIAQQVEQLRMSKGELASLVKEHEFTLHNYWSKQIAQKKLKMR